MIPHAGAILAIRGVNPAKRAETPSVCIICFTRGKVAVVEDEDMMRACRRVLMTSVGEVNNAAVVPLSAPLINATQAPSCPLRANIFLQLSYPAQYIPEKGTSRQRVGPKPLHKTKGPCALTKPRIDVNTDRSVWGLSAEGGVD